MGCTHRLHSQAASALLLQFQSHLVLKSQYSVIHACLGEVEVLPLWLVTDPAAVRLDT